MRRFEGLWPVMLTAFQEDGGLDLAGVDALVDFYLEGGSHGLFAVCQSSEMFFLDDDERLQLARRVVEHVARRVPVVATATFGGAVAAQAAFVRRMADTGVDAVIVLPNQFAVPDEGEHDLRPRLEQLLAETGDIPLGLYECPQPYHRLLSPDIVACAAATGRFRYIKDTARDPTRIEPKAQAAAGSPMALFNAAVGSALVSLRHGAAGVSPVAANIYPDLFAWLCNNVDHPRANWLQSRLTVMDAVVKLKYPQSAKRYLATRPGMPIGTRTRIAEHDWDGYDDLVQGALSDMVAGVRARVDAT